MTKEAIELAEWDWVTTNRWRRLHHPATVDGDDWPADVVTTCGLRGFAWIPGIFSRMGEQRCHWCCLKLGYPDGTGSPKNEDACRPLVEARLAA